MIAQSSPPAPQTVPAAKLTPMYQRIGRVRRRWTTSGASVRCQGRGLAALVLLRRGQIQHQPLLPPAGLVVPRGPRPGPQSPQHRLRADRDGVRGALAPRHFGPARRRRARRAQTEHRRVCGLDAEIAGRARFPAARRPPRSTAVAPWGSASPAARARRCTGRRRPGPTGGRSNRAWVSPLSAARVAARRQSSRSTLPSPHPPARPCWSATPTIGARLPPGACPGPAGRGPAPGG
jgi:hypothetical protein